MCINKLRQAIHHIQSEIGKKEMPAYWIEFLLLVAEAGDEGITTKKTVETLGMSQGIASRIVKLMSDCYFEKDFKAQYDKSNEDTPLVRFEGYGLLKTESDLVHRHRQRLFLSEKGKRIVEEAVSFMT